MKDMEMKQKVLSEIMDLMDQKDGENLKSHPKLMAAKIEVEKPKSAGVEDMLSKMKEGSADEESAESPEFEKKEDGEISQEDLKKLLDHFQGL